MKIWIKALLIAIIVMAVIKVSHYATTGLQQGFVIGSNSMNPNMQSGDLILVQSSQLVDIKTYEDSKLLDYKSFNDYGDVIAYKPFGKERSSPIIHRAMYYVEEGKPMWINGPPAPHAGYITKGDNVKTNPSYDQQGGISYNQPVKNEWIIGVAKVRDPYLGYLSSGMGGTILIGAVVYIIIILGYLIRTRKHTS